MLFLATDLIYWEIIKSLLVQVLHTLHSFPVFCHPTHCTHTHTHTQYTLPLPCALLILHK